MVVQTEVERALELTRVWSLGPPATVAGEATFVNWLSVALVDEKACTANQLVAELSLHHRPSAGQEGESDQLSADLAGVMKANRLGNVSLRYDLAILPPGVWAAEGRRGLGGDSTVFEVKAANSSRSLTKSKVLRDIRKLWVAQRYAEANGHDAPAAVMVLLATALKREDAAPKSRLETVRRWHDKLLAEGAPGVVLATLSNQALQLGVCKGHTPAR